MLSVEMKTIIQNYPAGMVATIRRDGTPAVSPKATFVILDDRTIAYGNIRSPHTLSNIRTQADVEIGFLDPLSRTAVRVKGQGRIVKPSEADAAVLDAFKAGWADYLARMTHFMIIDVTGVELIMSPAYDDGITREELVASNKAKLANLN